MKRRVVLQQIWNSKPSLLHLADTQHYILSGSLKCSFSFPLLHFLDTRDCRKPILGSMPISCLSSALWIWQPSSGSDHRYQVQLPYFPQKPASGAFRLRFWDSGYRVKLPKNPHTYKWGSHFTQCYEYVIVYTFLWTGVRFGDTFSSVAPVLFYNHQP